MYTKVRANRASVLALHQYNVTDLVALATSVNCAIIDILSAAVTISAADAYFLIKMPHVSAQAIHKTSSMAFDPHAVSDMPPTIYTF